MGRKIVGHESNQAQNDAISKSQETAYPPRN